LDLSAAGHCYKLKIYSEDQAGTRCLLETHDNTDTHSVDDHAIESKSGATSKRQVYGFDSFMNHSCQANAYFPLLYRTPNEMCYQALALCDIDAGMEVTCDYALFDYSCSGHEIVVCACGSKMCRGNMLGFQGERIEFDSL
jgi:SET domain-containing protein